MERTVVTSIINRLMILLHVAKRCLAQRATITRGVVAFVVGVSSVQLLPVLPSGWWCGALLGGAIVLWCGRQRCLAAGVLGICWAWWVAAERLAAQLPAEFEGRVVSLDGVVMDLPQRVADGIVLVLAVRATDQSPPAPPVARVKLRWRAPPVLPVVGERWRLRVRLRRARGFSNPGSFDYEAWLFQRHIGAIGYVLEGRDNRRIAQDRSLWSLPDRWREYLAGRVDQALAEHPLRGVIKALVLGAGADITPAQWQVFRRTGTTHLAVVSGSHLALVSGLAFVALRRLVRLPLRPAAVVAAFCALGYAALAGFNVPVQRAVVMTCIVWYAIWSRAAVWSFHTWFLAWLGVLLWDPTAVLTPGCWLSFAAVGLLLYTTQGRLQVPSGRYGWCYVHGITAVGLLPWLLGFFGQITPLAPVANALAVPVLGVWGVPAALSATALAACAPSLGEPALRLVADGLAWFWRVLEQLAALPIADWRRPRPPVALGILAGIGTLWLLAPRGIAQRRLGWMLLAPALLYSPDKPRTGELRLTLLDVGQGLSAVIETARHALVFDAGDRRGDFDLGQQVVAPFLIERGVNRIDTLMVSHADHDHSGGAPALLREFPVGAVYTSMPETLPELAAQPCRAGMHWVWDQVRFEMLHPVALLSTRENDNSCVLKVTAAAGSVLLTGDIEAAAEAALAARYGSALNSDVLVAPHHGSRTSSSWDFISDVQPRWVWFPVGYRNRFNFPAARVVRRYQALGAQVADTAHHGALSVVIDRHGMQPPRSHRLRHRRYWHAP